MNMKGVGVTSPVSSVLMNVDAKKKMVKMEMGEGWDLKKKKHID